MAGKTVFDCTKQTKVTLVYSGKELTYSEKELQGFKRADLLKICKQKADLCKVDLTEIVPKGAPKDYLIELILEFQEPAGGANLNVEAC